MLDDPHGASAVGISGSDYAARTRKLIKLMTDLRAEGAQTDFDLPRIAVIGNQSAGKSSLVEALSGITVPRASGTCTRCPMECRLVNSSRPWQCQVLIRKQVDENGVKIETAREEQFGPLLRDSSDLEEMLRRAQLAILNPSVPAKDFIDFDTKSLKPGDLPLGSMKQLQFSSNVVCLDLSSPSVTDLSFIDLPGIISNVAPGEDRGSIEAVKNMVKEHIQGNTLILLTITMRDDIDNQGAAFLARSEDVNGHRTIGVLTKPDTLQVGEEDAWLRILEGKRHNLTHGYFVTKQPSPKELEELMSFDQARQAEREYFQKQYPWKERTDLHHRLGTTNLTKELSKLLGHVINQALPELRMKWKDAHHDVKTQLDTLPPPPSENPASELLRLVTRFSAEVESLVLGSQSFEYLIQHCRSTYTTFKHDIRSTAPNFQPYTGPNDPLNSESQVEGEIDHGQGDSGDTKEPMYLLEVRAHIERSRTRELPFNVPFRAKISLIDGFFEHWANYGQKCFDDIHTVALNAFIRLVENHFSQFVGGPLLDRVKTIVEDQVEKARAKTQERIEWMLELEKPPYTLNDHYFSSRREKYLAQYKEARMPPDLSNNAAVQSVLSALNSIGFSGLNAQDLSRLHGNDQYEEEMIVMAETAAYFHVSYKRIIDNIPRIIDYDFLRSLGKEIMGALVDGLALGTDEATAKASMYLAEDEDVSLQRKSLLERQKRLDAVAKKLFNFGI